MYIHYLKALAPASTPRSRCTCFVLRRLTRRVTQAYDRALAGAGLTITQYSLLAHVSRRPGLSISSLADAMGMDRTTLVRTLRLVVDAGWASHGTRRAGRAAELVLTKAGAARLLAARPLWLRAQRDLDALLGSERVAALHALADESLAALTARAPA